MQYPPQRMASFGAKLQRLGAPGPKIQMLGTPSEGAASPATNAPPSLDELRDRIAAILGRSATPTRRADPTATELPFFLEATERGPRYVRRDPVPLGARVGRVPLGRARTADPGLLALLALDPALAQCDPTRALYLDTETTGLGSGAGTVAFLVGLAWFEPTRGEYVLEQILLRNLGEEAPLLELVRERLQDASMIVTYNGKAFDLPLLRTRFVMNRLQKPHEPPHLDLVHIARRVHKPRVRSCTLTCIESEVLGEERMFDVVGEDIVACYMHFLRSGDEQALLGVVEHNAMDVRSMVALLGLYGEPVGHLVAEDLAGLARTAARGGDLERAAFFAEEAVIAGGGASALRARGDIARARGDRDRALADYESIVRDVEEPAVRLALAKLYEHHVRAFEQALAHAELGTGEEPEAMARRVSRLRRKVERRRV